ncbi:MAG: hypothetical protein H0W77_07905, partial [Acidobacteria bacterium]|nr:hypothetical protein [Acidobacteriota bacterium]
AILATELNMPIVPVALDGLYKVWARDSGKINLAKVKMRFGKPFYPKDVLSDSSASADGLSKADSEAKYEAVTAYLKAEIQIMIDEMRR